MRSKNKTELQRVPWKPNFNQDKNTAAHGGHRPPLQKNKSSSPTAPLFCGRGFPAPRTPPTESRQRPRPHQVSRRGTLRIRRAPASPPQLTPQVGARPLPGERCFERAQPSRVCPSPNGIQLLHTKSGENLFAANEDDDEDDLTAIHWRHRRPQACDAWHASSAHLAKCAEADGTLVSHLRKCEKARALTVMRPWGR